MLILRNCFKEKSVLNKEIFRQELDQIETQIRLIEELDEVNANLQKNNWVFLHPYSQVGDIDVLKNIIIGKDNPDEEILRFFARKFFNLRGTIHFVEGFYNTRPFLKDFIDQIRESVVLCLQKDFRGAISVLIPVVEGTLRKFLIDKKGDHKSNEIDIKELLKSLRILNMEYVEVERKYLRIKYEVHIKNSTYLDVNQEKKILLKKKYYFDLWMKQIKGFIENKLYLNTKTNSVSDTFNRHLIFHGLEDNIEFSLGNYLRVFNSLNFLSWSIGSVTHGCSVLSAATESEVKSKYADYLNVLIVSEALTEWKNNLHTKPVESFANYLHPEQLVAIKRPVFEIKEILKLNDFFKD